MKGAGNRRSRRAFIWLQLNAHQPLCIAADWPSGNPASNGQCHVGWTSAHRPSVDQLSILRQALPTTARRFAWI